MAQKESQRAQPHSQRTHGQRRGSESQRRGSENSQAAGSAEEHRHQGGENAAQTMPWARGVHGAALATRLPRRTTRPAPGGLAVPELFDVITFFRARGDSYPIIASMGFWTEENPGKALTASALKIWYQSELKRRVPAKPARSKRP
jgi:hypothetical protein